LFGLAEIFADSGKKGIGVLHLLQKEQFPGIASNQPGLISKYWMLHIWVNFLGKFWNVFGYFGRMDERHLTGLIWTVPQSLLNLKQ